MGHEQGRATGVLDVDKNEKNKVFLQWSQKKQKEKGERGCYKKEYSYKTNKKTDKVNTYSLNT